MRLYVWREDYLPFQSRRTLEDELLKIYFNYFYWSIIARRKKKTFLNDQCKELEENNKMGKTKDLFKKIRDTKETFHAKMGTIKDRNHMDLIEAEDFEKRWQEYIEELYKIDLHDPDNLDDVIITWSQTFWNAKSSGP